LSRYPLVCRWDGPENPLPVRAVRARYQHAAPAGVNGASHAARPPGERPARAAETAEAPFDFCAHVNRLCADVGRRSEELRHVDVSRMLFAVTQARNGRAHGLQARVTPLRFRDGQLTRVRRGVTYQVQRYLVGGREMLYLVTFCLPRFLDLDFEEKLVTLFHELYHLSPAFDGDLRRHDGRYALHSHSQRRYDEHMARLARAYLADGADPELYAFLRLNFAELQRRYGGVVGVVVPRPKIVPVVAHANGHLVAGVLPSAEK
jgi:hypothetical protein